MVALWGWARPAAADSVFLTSTPDGGVTEPNGNSQSPSISADGRYVAFASQATNLVPNDTNGSWDIFVKDRQTLAIERVSIRSDGTAQPGDSTSPAISADGRYVAFVSNAALVAEDTNSCAGSAGPTCSDIYVHDRVTGQTTLVSVPIGSGVSGVSSAPAISGDGRFVVFASLATNLVNDGHGSAVQDVYVRDLTAGTTVRVSVSTDAAPTLMPDAASTTPSISRDGRVIMFLSAASNLDPTPDPVPCTIHDGLGTPYCSRIYLRDRVAGTVARLRIEDLAAQYVGLDPYRVGIPAAALSADGRTIVFNAEVTSPSLPGVRTEVQVYDRATRHGRRLMVVDSLTTKPRVLTVDGSGRYASFCDNSLTPGVTQTWILDITGTGNPNAPTSDSFILPPTGSTVPLICGGVAISDYGNQVSFGGPGSRFDPTLEAVFTLERDVDHDGMLDHWEQLVGLDPTTNDAALDPDGDGQTNLQEFHASSLPTGQFVRYLAEGASNAFFQTSIYIYNPSATTTALAQVQYLGESGQTVSQLLRVPPNTMFPLVPITTDAAFSTVVESTTVLAVERTMSWGADAQHRAYGSSAETAVSSPSSTWYFAEGATHGAFDLFYLLQNPSDTAADVTITYLLPAGQAPIVRTYALTAHSRRTIYVDQEPGLSATDVSAKVESSVPIFAERAMYLSTPTQSFAGGTAGAGIPMLKTRWFVAEGATGGFFDLYILIGNPSPLDANVTVSYLLPDGSSVDKTYLVAAQSRLTIGVDGEDPRLASTPVSAVVTSTNNVPIAVERAMWWPSPFWYEGSLTAATSDTSTAWALAGGDVGVRAGDETYLLLANPGDTPANVSLALRWIGEPQGVCDRTVQLPAHSRYTFGIHENCQALSAAVSVYGTVRSDGAGIVVERATYWSTDDQFWAAGASTLLTPIP